MESPTSTSSRPNIKKRSYYASDSERSKRLNANMIERRRMQNINCGFASLKKLLPPSDRKQTKAAILQQAAQYILRLQRAVIQFKSENDSLRSALESKNEKFTCAKHSSHSNPHVHQIPKRHYESTPNQHDLLLMAESTAKLLGSTHMDRHRNVTHKRTVLPKPSHAQIEVPGFDNSWKSFEHVKKYEPMISQSSGLQNRMDQVYPNAHAFESIPLTPPISPALNENRMGSCSSAGRSRGEAIVSPTFRASAVNKVMMAHHATVMPQVAHRVKPPKRNIFNSSTQTDAKAARHEKRVRPSYKTNEQTAEGREAKRSKEPRHGDLQCILDAINIIENTQNKKY